MEQMPVSPSPRRSPTWRKTDERRNHRLEGEAYARIAVRLPELLAALLRNSLPHFAPSPGGPFNGRPPARLHSVVFHGVIRAAFRQNLCSLEGAMDGPDYKGLNPGGGLSPATISRYFNDPALKPLLEKLLATTVWPIRRLESTVHADGTGLREYHVSILDRPIGPWMTTRRRSWNYMEVVWSYRYTMICAVYSQRGPFGEAPWLPALMERARLVVPIRDFGADAAYDAAYLREYAARRRLEFLVQHKPHSKRGRRTKRSEIVARRTSRRANAEAGNRAFKTLIGDQVYSLNDVAQRNEVLCMCIAYNLMRLVYWELEQGKTAHFGRGAKILAQAPWHDLAELRRLLDEELGRPPPPNPDARLPRLIE